MKTPKETAGIIDLPADKKESAAGLPATPRENSNLMGHSNRSDPPAQVPPREWFKFYTPSELTGFEPPEGFMLVGDCHITRGNVTVIAAAAGTGKSRAGTALAVAGATGKDWFGLHVHTRFKTAILQEENGRYRLKNEFAELDDETFDEYIRVSDRPPFGMAFDHPEFQAALTEWLMDFRPDVLVLDPWNSIAHDDRQKDYRQAFDAIYATLPKGDATPAIIIIAHTRKPKGDDRRHGRALLNEVSGSHVIGSVARCVFVMEAANDEETEDRIVWSCVKNNDGDLGPRTAWYRRNGLFAPCSGFDWEGFDAPAKNEAGKIATADLDKLFQNGSRVLARKRAVEELMEQTGLGQSACYNALAANGRFSKHLQKNATGLLEWNPSNQPTEKKNDAH